MGGPNQHFIPAHVLRGFAIKNDRKRAWVFTASSEPKAERIKKLGSADYFYGAPSETSGETLDDTITDYEDGLAKRIAALREVPLGTIADPLIPAEIVAHLTVRSKHVRGSMAAGFKLMLGKAFNLFSDEDGLRRLMGIDGKVPNERFRVLVKQLLSEQPVLRLARLPDAVLERVAFSFLRENVPLLHKQSKQLLPALFARLGTETDRIVKDSHIRALSQTLAPQARIDELIKLNWLVADTDGPVILPDCLALAVTNLGEVQPLFLAESIATVVMPLTSCRVLIGRKPEAEPFKLYLFNLHATACSEAFFVSSVNNDEIRQWSRFIGVQTHTTLHKALTDVFADYASPTAAQAMPEEPKAEPELTSQSGAAADAAATPWEISFGIQFKNCADEVTARVIAEAIRDVVHELREMIPLQRLDGITFAHDYPAALRELDRGLPFKLAPTTTEEADAVGVAMAPVVFRDGVIKAHIVFQGWIGHALIGQDQAAMRDALQIVVAQLAEAGCTELFDTAFPGEMLRPLPSYFDSFRYRHVSSAWSTYFSSRVSASYSTERGTRSRELLIAALQRAAQQIPRIRLDYRFHGDIQRLTDAAGRDVGYILHHAASLLGHIDGLSEGPIDDPELMSELDKRGLKAWFDLYRNDLRLLWSDRGEWETLEEFLALGHHLERLFWQFGIFLWQTPSGYCRAEVPIIIDALQFRKEMFRRPLQTLRLIFRNFWNRKFRRAAAIADHGSIP